MTASYLAQARFSKPYVVVWHEKRRAGAWYDRLLRLRASIVSEALLERARRGATSYLPDADYQDLAAPAWADRVSPVECEAWILFDDSSTADFLAAIPDA
ncbi:MAG: hypothetical protein GC151_17305 [Betaproteobacteria bacterium]|nr:hypothetical protein [Betaproteobacteria bacterium]